MIWITYREALDIIFKAETECDIYNNDVFICFTEEEENVHVQVFEKRKEVLECK